MGREAEAHAKIAAALQHNPHLKDRFGRPIAEGNTYTYQPMLPQLFTVAAIAPVLYRPDLPPGMFRVTLRSQVTVIIANGVPVDELALCYVRPEATAAEPPPPPAEGASLIQLTDAPDSPAAPANSSSTSEVPAHGTDRS